MKKWILIIVFIIISTNLFGAGSRTINILYQHSMRIDYREIELEIRSPNSSGRNYNINVIMRHLRGRNINGENIYSSEVNMIPIENEFFEYIYNELMDIDFQEILRSTENIVGADGNRVTIRFGTMNYITVSLWTPNSMIENVNIARVNQLIIEIFEKIGLLEWYT